MARGQRLTEILKQSQYSPLPVAHQVIILYAGVNGFLDVHPVNQLASYETHLIRYIDKKYPEIFEKIIQEGKLDESLQTKIKEVLREFEAIF